LARYRTGKNKCRRRVSFDRQALAADLVPSLVLVRDHFCDRRDQAGEQSVEVKLELKAFEKCVEQALKAIPREFRDMMENITIEVEPEQIVFDKDHNLILGLYTGVPLPQRGTGYRNVLPDKIVIYQHAFDNYPPSQLPALIANVLQHEIGHYFGMSEEQLAKYKKG
jgi:predicted Zn-dependent protease with MMP-like domain